MTATDLLHSHSTLVVGDLKFSVAPPTRASTLEVVVERDATLVIKAPASIDVGHARDFIASKRSWIYRRLAEKDALIGPPIVKSFVTGEGFAYLGRSYRLNIDDNATELRLDRRRFVLPTALVEDGRDAMRRWYIETGQAWLNRRITTWAARAGADGVSVEVRDLGYRGGSVRPGTAEIRMNIHWATLQLPPSLIDYVLVHELAHLTEANHSPAYWMIVSRIMPGYEAGKQTLASIGKNVWLR